MTTLFRITIWQMHDGQMKSVDHELVEALSVGAALIKCASRRSLEKINTREVTDLETVKRMRTPEGREVVLTAAIV